MPIATYMSRNVPVHMRTQVEFDDAWTYVALSPAAVGSFGFLPRFLGTTNGASRCASCFTFGVELVLVVAAVVAAVQVLSLECAGSCFVVRSGVSTTI
jgi:hypothetical protein